MGGGVIGLSVARALGLRKAGKVILIERSQPGEEASFAAAGMLAPQAEADKADDFFRLACKSRDLYPDFSAALHQDTGVDVELDTTGTLYLAFTDDDEREIEDRYRWQTDAGLLVEKLSYSEALQLEPSITPDLRMALRFPLDIQVENRQLLSALVAANQNLGVRLMTNTTVTSLETGRAGVEGVHIANGFLSSRTVVIAGGAWSSTISGLRELNIEPVRGQMVCLDSGSRIFRHVIYSPRGYVVPRASGRLLAGSTTEHVAFDKRVTAGGIHSIVTRALEISPAIYALPLVDCWAGLRPRAPDNLPVLGPVFKIEGLFYATGHYRNGILLAPITAELIAEAIMGNFDSSQFGVFTASRFHAVSAN